MYRPFVSLGDPLKESGLKHGMSQGHTPSADLMPTSTAIRDLAFCSANQPVALNTPRVWGIM
jgi:hypothetical protein